LRHDVPARYPAIGFIFSHAGGAAPYLACRLSLMESFVTSGRELRVEEDRAAIKRGLQSFYYDTALSSIDSVLALLGEIVGMDRVLFGSDYPQVPYDFIHAAAHSVFCSTAISGKDRKQVQRGNGLRLFPRLAK
jgi:6-methylsalicylate decarboxylase